MSHVLFGRLRRKSSTKGKGKELLSCFIYYAQDTHTKLSFIKLTPAYEMVYNMIATRSELGLTVCMFHVVPWFH